MGDPAGACAHARDRLAPDGTLLLIEPFAHDDLSDNLNPVGAAYYGFSTLLCTPSSTVVPGSWRRAGRAGGGVPAAGHRCRRRVHNLPPGGRDAIQHCAGGESVMKFAQIIEFRTSQIADFDDYFDAWIARTQGDRISHRAVLTRDRDADNQYMLTVEFASHDQGMEGSNCRVPGGVCLVPCRDLRRPANLPQPGCAARRRPVGTCGEGESHHREAAASPRQAAAVDVETLLLSSSESEDGELSRPRSPPRTSSSGSGSSTAKWSEPLVRSYPARRSPRPASTSPLWGRYARWFLNAAKPATIFPLTRKRRHAVGDALLGVWDNRSD